MENKFLPLGYAEMLERMKYKDMLERMSSTTDPKYAGVPEQFVSPREPGPTEKLGNLIGKGLMKLPFGFDDERSAMRSGQDVANVLAFAPGPGNVLGYLEGRKLEEEGRPFLGSVIKAASVGLPGAGKGAASVTPPPVKPAPTPKGIEHKILHTADRPSDMKDPSDIEAWGLGLADEKFEDDLVTGYRDPYTETNKSLMPLRYGENDTQMTSQLALFESDLYTAKNKNKLYPIENILQAMRRYGVTGKGNVNQNVARQIEDFISPEFIANNPKTTPASVMEELQKNAPKIQETHAYYNLGSTMDPDRVIPFVNLTTRRPLYDLDSPTTTLGNSPQQTSRSYGERKFSMFDDGRIYGEQPQVDYTRQATDTSTDTTFINKKHQEVASGIVDPEDTLRANKYMHQRYTFEDIDGDANVLVGQEIQSDPYTFTRDQNILAARVSGTDDVGVEGRGMSTIETLQYEFQNYTEPGDQALHARINSGDFEAVGDMLKTRGVAGGHGEMLHSHLVKTNKLDEFNQELGTLMKKHSEDIEDQRLLINTFNEGDSGYEQAVQDFQELVDRLDQRAIRIFAKYNQELADSTKPINLPRSVDWFTDNVKLFLQTGAKNDSPYVLLPKGSRSVAPSSGNTRVIPPKMIPFLEKRYKNKEGVRLDYDDDGKFLGVSEKTSDGTFRRELYAEPDPESVNRAKNYDDFYKKAIKQTEQDYGVKLNPTEYIDQYGQEYLKIILTPELKSSFQTFRMKHGGAASIIPLKYGF